MTEINRQKFIAELTKLLTFMFEEDQRLVLAMYNSLFDNAVDEAALVDFFNSPTKQAVSLARSYNAKMRKLQVHSTSRADMDYEDNGDELPEFIGVLEKLRDEAEAKGLVSNGKTAAQSVWTPPITEEKNEEPRSWFKAETELEEKSEEPAVQIQEKPVEEIKKQPEPEIIEHAEPEIIEQVEPEIIERVEPEIIRDDFANKKYDESKAPEDQDKLEIPIPVPENDEELKFTLDEVVPDTRKEEKHVPVQRKLIIPLAILYGIFAAPLAIAISVVLLVPTFASLGVSGVCIYAGVKTLLAAFSGFSMFSDIMVVLGCGLVIVSLGLLFLWLFVWFVGGAIAGIINAFISLGNKWCSREVSAK